MKRQFFFWFDKLNITQHERRALFCLLLLLSSLVLVNAVVQPKLPYNGDYYAALDRTFKAKTNKMKKREHLLLMKYKGLKRTKLKPRIEKIDTTKTDNRKVSADSSHTKLININTAGVRELQKLQGIGPIYARRIIAYRRKHGPFKTKDALIKIKGIGKKRLAKIKPFIQLTATQ